MPSSTSSFERALPPVPWLRLLGLAVLFFLVAAFVIEERLAGLGYQTTARDSQARWQAERARAGRLGERALILVGGSRFQLGLDIDVLRKKTGLEPVQLALDGSAGKPILDGLASDPKIRGTVLVDYYDHAIGSRDGVAEHMQRQYEKSAGRLSHWKNPAGHIEADLTKWLRERLRAYSDGASPLSSLRWRIIPAAEARQYLITRPDRSRLADYTRVSMPEFYYRRVARTLGEDIDTKSPNIAAALAQRIASLATADNAAFLLAAGQIGQTAERIRARGGQVIFVAMPSSGMVREIERRRYPRDRFWDRFVAESGLPGIHSDHEPELRGYECPDGSHLDVRDKGRYTSALADVMKRKGLGRLRDAGRRK